MDLASVLEIFQEKNSLLFKRISYCTIFVFPSRNFSFFRIDFMKLALWCKTAYIFIYCIYQLWFQFNFSIETIKITASDIFYSIRSVSGACIFLLFSSTSLGASIYHVKWKFWNVQSTYLLTTDSLNLFATWTETRSCPKIAAGQKMF